MIDPREQNDYDDDTWWQALDDEAAQYDFWEEMTDEGE